MKDIDYGAWPHACGYEDRIIEVDGNLHYRPNTVVRWLLDFGNVSLDQIWTTYGAGGFSLGDMMEFYRLMGYSLEGFEEIWHSKDPATREPE